jgi:N-acetylneuraminic acid mutarotase
VIVPYEDYWLKPVLLQSKLVLTSSDLHHVKVTRHNAPSGQQREWVVDCSGNNNPFLWLRDGDKVEVPEKSTASAAEEAEAPPPSARAQPLLPSAPGAPARSTFVQQLNRVPQSPAPDPVGKPLLFETLLDAPTLKGLLEGGADPNVRTPDGTPLLVQAVRERNQLAAELLLSHHAEVNAADSVGWTPLDYATADGLKGIVELLLQAGATVNARNPSGDTPLHIAVRLGQRELAELLLAHKADPNVRNNAGQTPLALAQSMGLSLGMGGAGPLAPGSETPSAIEQKYLNISGVLYSPKPHDPALLDAGYHRDRSAKTRKAECWEQRARAELSGRGGNTIWTGTEMIEFGGEGMGTTFGDGARYCFAEDTWAALPQEGAPSSRSGHAMVWTGKEMIVWGGFGGVGGNDTLHNDGARYNPSSDTWKPVSEWNAPSARVDFPAVWTGREMLFWGGFTDTHSRYQGYHADAHLNTGGRYDPSSDSWKTITTQGAPSKRCGHTLVWTGKEAIVWGGANATRALNDGARYDPARDSWRPVSADGAPSPRLAHVAFWTGKEMLVWGGTTREVDTQGVYFENGARYNPETDTWRPLSTIGAPMGRVVGTAFWTGKEMIVWGGVNDAQARKGLAGFDPNRYVGTGARYNPATDTWTEITLTGAPSSRVAASGVWTGGGLLLFGGYNGTHFNETWFYSPSRTVYAYVKE